MDFHMPVMDGMEATARMRRAHGERAPPVIGVTADAMVISTKTFQSKGAVTVLAKPYKLKKLGDTVTAHARPITWSQ